MQKLARLCKTSKSLKYQTCSLSDDNLKIDYFKKFMITNRCWSFSLIEIGYP